MSNRNPFNDYVRDLRANVERGDSTEHAHGQAAHGADLVALHLLQSPKLDHFITEFPEKGTNEVDRVIFNVGGASSSPLRTREQDVSRRSASAQADAPATMAQASRLPSAKVVQASRLVPACRDLPNPNEARQAGAASSDHSIKNQKSAITNPCVWSFRIGGYQVCEKWLKDRKGRPLDYADLQHYQRIVVAVSETIRLMGEIDRTIASHGGWPDAIGGGSSVGAVVFECETC